MPDQIYIQHRFTIVDSYGTFQDAIVLLQVDYNSLTPKQISDTKIARLAGWKKAIDDAKLIPPPTKTEQLAKVNTRLAEVNKELADLTAQKVELEK